MRARIAMYVAVPTLGLALLGVGVASAMGPGQGDGWGWGHFGGPSAEQTGETFVQQAELLGVSVDQVKEAWSAGQGLPELATSLGLTREQLRQKMRDAAHARQATAMQDMVSKGIITQEQADQRQAFLNSRPATGQGLGQGRRADGGKGRYGAGCHQPSISGDK